MPQPYEMPGNLTGLKDLWDYGNTVTGNTFTVLAVIAITAVALATMIINGKKISVSLFVSFFIGFFLGVMLWGAGLLLGKYVTIWLLLTIGFGIWAYLDN